MATRTVECQICLEDLNDPRLLPCTHSFCLKCLEVYCRDKLPGDDVPCPVCKNEFQIPKNGVAGLLVRTHTKEPTLSEPGGERHCTEHNEHIKIYCFDCNMNVCAMCCFEAHKTHKCERIETVVEQFSRSIDDEIKHVTSRIECFRGVVAQLEAESNKTLDNINAIELEVKKRSKANKHFLDQVKQLVDRQESDLLHELQSLKSAAEKEVRSQRGALQLAVTEMESFITSSLELRSKGSPSDITQAANDVRDRAKQLLQTWVIPGEYHAPSYKFTPVNIDELLRDDQSLIGHVVKDSDSGANKRGAYDADDDDEGVRKFGRASYIVSRVGIAVTVVIVAICLGVVYSSCGNYQYTQRAQESAQPTGDDPTTGDDPSHESVQPTGDDPSAARVIKKISTDNWVFGVTSVDDELFVLLVRDNNQVAVYSINDYQLLRHLNVPGFKPDVLSDMTSCVRHKCLYMSDYDNRCIYRYHLASRAITKWPLPYKPFGLSVTPSCNLLVTCHGEPNKLVELSADSGQCVREIALQSDIVWPWHGVQLTTGQLVVCHGGVHSDLHRVCVVGDDGKVTRSYGGRSGSNVGQLDYPRHLAVDKDSQFIFVADWFNDRAVLFSPTLEFIRYVSEGLSRPWRLYLHQATRRLFVGQWGGDVTVIQL